MKRVLLYCISPGARGSSVAHEWLLHGSGAGDAEEPKLSSKEDEPTQANAVVFWGVPSLPA